MTVPFEPGVSHEAKIICEKLNAGSGRIGNSRRTPKIFCALLAMACPFAAAFAQSSSSSQQSSSASQQSSAQPQTPSQTQPVALDPPPPKQDSLAEAARKAKAKKTDAPKSKVYTEDDLKGMKGPGVSVVGDPPKRGSRRAQPADPDDDNGTNTEAYWRDRSWQFEKSAPSRFLAQTNFCATNQTDTKTDPLTSSFWKHKRYKLTAMAGLHPRPGESCRVLRPLWTELPAQTVRVYSL